ncbi:uncharacterized protein PHACADRAFT_90889, partial [Phanerochaete carnosa HHB-10118-sp]
YDHVITFDQEVRTVWQQKFSIVSLLIVSTRWMLLLQVASPVIALIPHGSMPHICKVLCLSGIAHCGYFRAAVFSALRVCTIRNQNSILFTIALTLSLAPVVANAVSLTLLAVCFCHPVNVPITDCCFTVLFFSRISLIAADLLVLVVTWRKTYCQYREARLLNIRSPFATYLIHDGKVLLFTPVARPSITFVVPSLILTRSILLVLNVSQILSFYFVSDPPPITPIRPTEYLQVSTTIVTAFANIMPQILVCRFMMNLRLLNQGTSTNSDIETSQQLPSPRTLTSNDEAAPDFMGNMGEPLEYGQDDERDYDAHIGNDQAVAHSAEELAVSADVQRL